MCLKKCIESKNINLISDLQHDNTFIQTYEHLLLQSNNNYSPVFCLTFKNFVEQI